MYEKAKKFTLTRPRVKKTLGVFFVVFGIAGMVAPIIPGAPMLFIGLELLGFHLLFLDKILRRAPVEVQE